MNDNLVESLTEALPAPANPLARALFVAANELHLQRVRLETSLFKRVPVHSPLLGPLVRRLDFMGRYQAWVISVDPPILYLQMGGARPVQLLDALSQPLSGKDAVFLMMVAGTMENPHPLGKVVAGIAAHRKVEPRHEVIILANTPKEEAMMLERGAAAVFCNHNIFVSEKVFRPLPGATRDFDAVYNARLSRKKRQYLAFDIDRLLYVATLIDYDFAPVGGRAYLARMLAQSPRHAIANPVKDGLPVKIPAAEVNAAYNRSAVGLCLSAVEGAMYSSMEYLLAGLPVVTTPNRGGRDVFFHPDYCITADANPRAIREAVEALRDRNIPRDYVRQRTLTLVEPERRKFLALLDGLLERRGYQPRYGSEWPFSDDPILPRSRPAAEHMAPFLKQQSASA